MEKETSMEEDQTDDEERAMIEQIKRESLKMLEDMEKEKVSGIQDQNTSMTDIFYQGEDAKGFFLASGETYVYPTNYPIRVYQKNIVHTCLFYNTLVSLPTGLGKTFIAAVVMYNFYRWYPMGKVVFMAPTRPLVSQQMRACYDIMGIPVEDTIELLGSTAVGLRKKEWDEKRVFFVTPQVIDNDLKNNICNPKNLKCLVIDEAHKATKNYAYCQVVQQLQEANIKFRLVALSATPGKEIADVINLIQKLDISKLELRSENSMDIAPYTHSRNIESVQVPLSDLVMQVREEFLKIIDKYTRSLKQNKVLVGNTGTLTRFLVMLHKDRYNKSKAQFQHINRDLDRVIQRDFHITLSLAGALEQLTTYGLRAFYQSLIETSSEEGSCPLLSRDHDLILLLEHLRSKLEVKEISNNYAWSHLKFVRLKEIVEKHFQTFAEKGENTKVIIFANFRVVVSEIYEMLKPLEPMIKATMFIGQSSGQKKAGQKQAEQKEIMAKFRAGEFNTMIATSVAEEGLDIGEVDLVICFEAHKSPIRLVQRIGRTGRKRNGRCVVLLTQGKEAANFQTCMQSCKNYVEKIMSNKNIYSHLNQNGPRMIPAHINPTMNCLHIYVKKRVTPAKPSKKKKGKEKENDVPKKKGAKRLNLNNSIDSDMKPVKPSKNKKTKKETTESKDIRTCFANMNRKPIVIDYTQSTDEPECKDDDVFIIEPPENSEEIEFENIFKELKSWAEKCDVADEIVLDDQFFSLMDNFLIDDDDDHDDGDETPVDLMDVDHLIDNEYDLPRHEISPKAFNNVDINLALSPDLRVTSPNLQVTSPDIPSASTNIRATSPDLACFANDNNEYDDFKSEDNNNPFLDHVPVESDNLAVQKDIQSDYERKEYKEIQNTKENIWDDGNENVFLDLNFMTPSSSRPTKINNATSPKMQSSPNKTIPINENPKLDKLIEQSVDDLFVSDDETEKVEHIFDIKSYFVSDSQVKHMEQNDDNVSVSDLFQDSSDEDGNVNLNENLHAPESVNMFNDKSENLFDKYCESPKLNGNQNQWPSSSTPVNNKKQYLTPNKNITNIPSPDTNDMFIVKSSSKLVSQFIKPIQSSNVKQDMFTSPDLEQLCLDDKENCAKTVNKSPFTPKQKVSDLYKSPDLTQKSQCVNLTKSKNIKLNLETKFNKTIESKSTSKIIFDTDSEEDDFKIPNKTSFNKSSKILDETSNMSNMFTVTQLIEMANERKKDKECLDKQDNFTKPDNSKKEICQEVDVDLKDLDFDEPFMVNIPDELCKSVNENIINLVTPEKDFPSHSGRVMSEIKLDGLDIVDSDDDIDNMFVISSQDHLSTQNLINNYKMANNVSNNKPKLPNTSSVLETLAYVEENKINNPRNLIQYNNFLSTMSDNKPVQISQNKSNIDFKMNPIRNKQSLVTNQSRSEKQNVIPSQARPESKPSLLSQSKPKAKVDSSSDDDIDFFIPERNKAKANANKNSKSIPSSPNLLSKVKIKVPNKKISKCLDESLTNKINSNVSSTMNSFKQINENKQSNEQINTELNKPRFKTNTDSDNSDIFEKPSTSKDWLSVQKSNKPQSIMNSARLLSQVNKQSNENAISNNEFKRIKSNENNSNIFDQPSSSRNILEKPPSMSQSMLRNSTEKISNQNSQSQKTQNKDDKKLEQLFGCMSDEQFEKWLKEMNSEKNDEGIVSQYFEQPSSSTSHNVNTILMNNRQNFNKINSQKKTLSQKTIKVSTNVNKIKNLTQKTINDTFKKPNTKNNITKFNNDIVVLSSDEDEDIFCVKPRNKPNKSEIKNNKNNAKSNTEKTKNNASKNKNIKISKRKTKPANPYIEVEADVSLVDGDASSDDDLTNTSSDEMDSSFIDDEINNADHTMGNYLKSVKSPTHAQKFKIPVLSDEVLNMDVYSQAVPPDRSEYFNDSFCVSDNDDAIDEDEKSLLEIAEMELKRQRKLKKNKKINENKKRRRVRTMDSSSDEN